MKKYFFTVLLLIVSINLSGSSIPSEEELLDKLKNCDYFDCPNVVEWCGLLRVRKSVPLLVQLLENRKSDCYWELRKDIVKALGKIGDPDAIGILLRCLPNRDALFALKRIDPDWKNRPETSEYFVRQLDKFYKNKESDNIRELFKIIISMDFDVQQEKNICLEIISKKDIEMFLIEDVVDHLVKLKALEAVEPLMTRLENIATKDFETGDYYVNALDSLMPDWRQTQRGKALESRILFEFKRVKAEITQPIDCYEESEMEDYSNQIRTLTWYPSGVLLLLETARDEQGVTDFRFHSILALGDIAKPGETDILCTLIKLLNDKNPMIISLALEGLNYLGRRYEGNAPAEPAAQEIVGTLLNLMEKEGSEEISRDQLIDGLLIWGDERVAPILLNLLKQNPNPNLYSFSDNTLQILDKLIELGHPETFTELMRLYDAADKGGKIWRDEYIKIMGELKDPRALPLLQKALTDRERRIRAYAEWAIYHITKE
jgi:HEAT repeat protein